jgi:hypothetical protein
MDAFLKVAGPDAAKLQKQVEDWYDSSMDRVSGWYKRRSQVIVFVMGVVMTVLVNADCIQIGKRLFTDASLRDAVGRLAGQIKQTPRPSPAPANNGLSPSAGAQVPGTSNGQAQPAAPLNNPTPEAQATNQPSAADLKGELADLDSIGLPLGTPEWKWAYFGDHWLGWLITVLAISLGAPFWFDLLNKFMVIRSTVKPSEKSGDEASKDPQPPAPRVLLTVPSPPSPGAVQIQPPPVQP